MSRHSPGPARFRRGALCALLANGLLSFTSGAVWFVLHRWFRPIGDFGPEPHPWEAWLLRVHGASAFLALTGFGAVLAGHVRAGWRMRRNRISGVALVSAVALLAASGYWLYYGWIETARDAVSWIHLGLGLLLPLAFGLHLMPRRGR